MYVRTLNWGGGFVRPLDPFKKLYSIPSFSSKQFKNIFNLTHNFLLQTYFAVAKRFALRSLGEGRAYHLLAQT